MQALASQTKELFVKHFDAEPEAVAVAPGRVELLGNHTDYNQGLVLGLAIDRYIAVAGKKTQDSNITIYSSDLNDQATCSLDALQPEPNAKWTNYPFGVVDQFRKAGHRLPGIQMAVKGNLPLNSGLSSSAALLVSTALCIQKLFGIPMDKMPLAKLAHAAEHDFAGANNGLLDHFCSVFGKKNHALYLDCRSLDHEVSPIVSKDLTVAVCQTNVKHSIVEGEYQARRKECAAAVEFFQSRKQGVQALRDVTSSDLAQWGRDMEPVQLQRAKHIVGENERVEKGKSLLAKGNLEKFGRLLYESHESSRVNFENSCPELDTIVNIAKSVNGVWGSRLTGGGFGGCSLVFIKNNRADILREAVMNEYPKHSDKTPEVLFCKVVDGAQVVEV